MGRRGKGGEGGGYPDPEIRGRGQSHKKIFQPFGPQFGLKIRGGAGAGLSPGSATASPRWTVGAGPKGVFLQES